MPLLNALQAGLSGGSASGDPTSNTIDTPFVNSVNTSPTVFAPIGQNPNFEVAFGNGSSNNFRMGSNPRRNAIAGFTGNGTLLFIGALALGFMLLRRGK